MARVNVKAHGGVGANGRRKVTIRAQAGAGVTTGARACQAALA